MQIGLRAADFLDPITSHGSSTLGQLYYLSAITFFFVVDGHHWVLAALARSYERIPPGQIALGGPTLDLLLNAMASALDIAVRLGAAGIAALLLADIALAIIGRHVPQMNVFLVGMPAKLGAGLLVLALSASLLGFAFSGLITDARHYVDALLGR
jgi:flagellar biosynthesis protein FliR